MVFFRQQSLFPCLPSAWARRSLSGNRESLALLEKLGSVESLKVWNSRPKSERSVDDLVPASFANFPKLKELEISDCLLSENGWKLVAGLSHLQVLHIRDDRIPEDRIKSLQNALPHCAIDRSPRIEK